MATATGLILALLGALPPVAPSGAEQPATTRASPVAQSARVSPPMISNAFSDVRTKSRQRLSDLCHMHDVKKSQKKRQDVLPLLQ